MNLVIDASVTVAWDQVSETGAIVPTLWWLELANAFQSAIRRKRMTAFYRDQALAELLQMSVATHGFDFSERTGP